VAHLSATQHQRRIQDLCQGKCDGLAHALDIMFNAADTQVAPGIAGKNQLPAGAVEHARQLMGETRRTGCSGTTSDERGQADTAGGPRSRWMGTS
jgi:hypothetical protein